MSQRDTKFYSELKQMNEDLVQFIKNTHEKSPYSDFTPTVNDYVKQIADLLKLYPEKSANPTQISSTLNPSATPFSFSTPFQMGSTTFGSAINPSGIGSSLSSVSTPFRFTLAKKDDDETNSTTFNTTSTNQNDLKPDPEDDAPPPLPNVDKYEEPDSKYSVKCKLYEKGKPTDGGETCINLVGIGFLYVKALDTPLKLQVIFRQEPDLRRVLLNEVITPSIPVRRLPKAVQMVFPCSTGETKNYIAKVKDENDADVLFSTLGSIKS